MLARPTYPSVTEIIGRFLNPYKGISPDMLVRAAHRGQEVHKYVHLINDQFFVPGIPEEIQGYIEGFEDWKDKVVDKVIWSEKEFIDSTNQVVAHPDMLVKLKNNRHSTIVEAKCTATIFKTHYIQTAIYQHITKAKGRMILQLFPDGSYRVPPLKNDGGDLQAFLYLRWLYKYIEGK